jgi:prepilin signal peptidase PulO-like enzyme (type II secretory pathway)
MLQKIELYLISLGPLFVLLLVSTAQIPYCGGENCQFIGWGNLLYSNVVPVICSAVLIATTVMYFRFNYMTQGATQMPEKIAEIENIQFENLSFLATYIIPLVAFDLSQTRGCVMLLLVLILMGSIFINTNTFYLNPSLAVLGYRIYKVVTSTNEKIIVITREKLNKDDSIFPRSIGENIYFASKAKNEQTTSN